MFKNIYIQTDSLASKFDVNNNSKKIEILEADICNIKKQIRQLMVDKLLNGEVIISDVAESYDEINAIYNLLLLKRGKIKMEDEYLIFLDKNGELLEKPILVETVYDADALMEFAPIGTVIQGIYGKDELIMKYGFKEEDFYK